MARTARTPTAARDTASDVASVASPRLRFPKFRERPQWARETLGDIGDTLPGLSGKSAEDFGEGEPFVTYKQVFGAPVINRAECGKVRVGSAERQTRLRYGDVLITGSSETPGEVGWASMILDQSDDPLYLNSFCFAFRQNDKAALLPAFERYLFHSPAYRAGVRLLAQGAIRYNISKSGFLGIQLPFPSDTAEQQKIADCLTSLDEVIAAQGRKVEALNAHKKGLVQHLFPQEGQTLPRLRFPEFRDEPEWRTGKIGKILEKRSETATLDEGALYREIGVRSHGKGLFHKEPTTGKAIGSKRVFHVVPNALVINIVFAWEQAIAVTTDAETGFIASHRFPMFVPKDDQCDVSFMQRLFLTPVGKQMLKVASPGGAGRNRTLSQTEFENLDVDIPSTAEQQRIAACLSTLDARLAAEADRLDALKAHKKGLMQGLFPSPEGD